MGNRLKDYGFVSPFRGNNLEGSNINQWLLDTATYNKILQDYGVTSTVEFKQSNGSWGATPPQRWGNSQWQESDMPEYRWTMTGDVAGANAALLSSGLQTQRTGPRGQTIIEGAYIPTTVAGAKETVNGRLGRETRFVSSNDPLGISGNVSRLDTPRGENWGNAYRRVFGSVPLQQGGPREGPQIPTYYISPGAEARDWPRNTIIEGPPQTSQEALSIARALFSDPNFSTFVRNPSGLSSVFQANPDFANQLQTKIYDIAAQYRSMDDSGGALGVIARGLGQVASFAGMAAGLHGLMAGLGAVTSGAGLSGAINAGMSAAGGMTDFGGIVGDIVGNTAVGNIANVGQAALTGGVEGGVPGAVIGAGGAAIGAGIGEAGGVGEFLADPLGALGGAFNVGAAGGAAGGLLDMADAAQVGPGSLASNTPPVTGPIADEIFTVTASAPGSTGNYGWLASTLAARGIPAGAQLITDDRGYLTGYSYVNQARNLQLGLDPNSATIGMLSDATGAGAIAPDFVNGAPSNTAVGGPGAGGTADTGGVAGGQTQGGSGASTGGAIGGAVTDILGGGTGTSVIGSGTTGTGLAGGTTDLTGVGGSGTTGAGTGGAGTGPGTGTTGSGGVSGTGGTGTGTGGLLDTGVTPGTGGMTGPAVTEAESAAYIEDYIQSIINPRPVGNGISGTTPGTTPGTTTGGTTGPTTPTGPTPGNPEYTNEMIQQMMAEAAASGGSDMSGMFSPTSSWAGQVSGPMQNFVTPAPAAPIFGSGEWVQQQIDNAIGGGSGMSGIPSPANSWAGQLTGGVPNFGAEAGTGTATGTGNQGGLTDAELAALLTAGAVGTGVALGGGQDGLGTTAGTSTGFNSTVGPGTGPGTDTGTGPGTGGGTGTGNGTGDGDGTGQNPGLDQFSSQLQGLLQTGFQPGTGADFMDPFSVGSLIKPGQTQMPKTPARKKKGIRVNISGRYRNA